MRHLIRPSLNGWKALKKYVVTTVSEAASAGDQVMLFQESLWFIALELTDLAWVIDHGFIRLALSNRYE